MMMLAERTLETTEKLRAFGEVIESRLLSETVCVYATGSFGRGEAGSSSDLDLFIASKAVGERFSRLNQIELKAALISAMRNMEIPPPDADGEYLQHYEVTELVKEIGTPSDDKKNTFTARLLLLLESSPVVGLPTYNNIIDDVLAAYWSDYERHMNEFVPAYLINDILRLWRTFCVNYEARTKNGTPDERLK